jgi:hypothetical protein
MLVEPTLQQTLAIGGRVFTDLANLICLLGNTDSGAGGQNTTLRKSTATTAYQVPASKQFRVRAVRLHCIASAAASRMIQLLYSDNDMGVTSNTAPTNPVYVGGHTNNSHLGSLVQAATNPQIEFAFDWVVPTTKYIGAIGTTSSWVQVQVFGYEESV